MAALLLAVLTVIDVAPVPRGLAVLSSATAPGTGQLLLGARRGEAQVWVDGLLWTAWAGFVWYAGARETDARLLAASDARADLGVPALRYYKAMESYDNAEEYNEQVRSDARARYPDDPQRQHRYADSLSFIGSAAWDWSSDSLRFDYWERRRSGRTAALRAKFAVAALVLNRLVAVVDCAFLVKEERVSQRVGILSAADEPGILVCWRF